MNPEKTIIEKAIRAMIKTGAIKFKPFSKYRGVVDVEITSDVFTDKTFITSVYEDDWNNYPPAHAVSAELADLIISEDIEFVSLTE